MKLIEKVRAFVKGQTESFTLGKSAELPRDVQLAIAAVLLEVAHGDAECSNDEYREIVSNLRDEIGLSRSETNELLEAADEERFTQLAVSPFIERIRDGLSMRQRVEFLALVWRVILADSQIEEFESTFVSWLPQVLGLSEQDADEAKRLAKPDA